MSQWTIEDMQAALNSCAQGPPAAFWVIYRAVARTALDEARKQRNDADRLREIIRAGYLGDLERVYDEGRVLTEDLA
jgi:hypothetical protein